jgi:hypothetical protein
MIKFRAILFAVRPFGSSDKRVNQFVRPIPPCLSNTQQRITRSHCFADYRGAQQQQKRLAQLVGRQHLA